MKWLLMTLTMTDAVCRGPHMQAAYSSDRGQEVHQLFSYRSKSKLCIIWIGCIN